MFILVRTLHILAGIWFTCGVAAYTVTRLAMLQEQDIRSVDTLMRLTGRIMLLLMRPGGMLVVILGLWTAYYESWPRFSLEALVLLAIFVPFMVLTGKGSHRLQAATAEAVQAGSITPALRAAMHDRQLVIGSTGIAVITLLFLLLMTVKPS